MDGRPADLPGDAVGRGRHARRDSRTARALPFRHENETARPHYYGVDLRERGQGRDRADRPRGDAALHLPGDDASVIFDNVNNEAGLTLDPDTGVVTGFSDVKQRAVHRRHPAVRVRRLRRAGHRRRRLTDGGPASPALASTRAGPHGDHAHRHLAHQRRPGEDNLDQEMSGGTRFEPVHGRGAGAVGRHAGHGRGRGRHPTTSSPRSTPTCTGCTSTRTPASRTPAPPARRAQYTRSPLLAQTGQTRRPRTGAKIVDGKVYVNNGFWDTYRTTWPAYSLLTPNRRASWSTASSSSTRTAAGSPAGPRPATPT